MVLRVGPCLTFPQVDPPGGDTYSYHDPRVIGLTSSRVVVAFVLTPSGTASTLRLYLLDQDGTQIATTDLAWIGGGDLVSANLDGEMPDLNIARVDDAHLLETGKGYAFTYPYAPYMVVRRIAVADDGFLVDYEVRGVIPDTAFISDGYYPRGQLTVGTDLGLVLVRAPDYSGDASAIMAIDTDTGRPVWVGDPFVNYTYFSGEMMVAAQTVTMYWVDSDGSSGLYRSWNFTRTGVTAVDAARPWGQHVDERVAHLDSFYTGGEYASLGVDGDTVISRLGDVDTTTVSIVSGLVGVARCSAKDFALILAVPD